MWKLYLKKIKGYTSMNEENMLKHVPYNIFSRRKNNFKCIFAISLWANNILFIYSIFMYLSHKGITARSLIWVEICICLRLDTCGGVESCPNVYNVFVLAYAQELFHISCQSYIIMDIIIIVCCIVTFKDRHYTRT